MEPRIQYAKASDGVNIAYWTLGEGEGDPLVFMPPPYSHSQLEWQLEESRYWWEQLAAPRKLIRYDQRGAGLSARDVTDFSLEAQVNDLAAVVERSGVKRFVLFANVWLSAVAVVYAARHPERVSRMIMWCPFVRPAAQPDSSRFAAMRSLRDQDWELYTDTIAHTVFGWSAGESGERFAKLMRESATRETSLAISDETSKWDASDLVPSVKSPTLVIQRRGVAVPPLDVTRELTAQLPDASLVLLEGESLSPYVGDVDSVLEAVNGFLGDAASPANQAGEGASGPFRTILFTDVEGSTALTERLGDDKARELLREHERITREALTAHEGSEVKTMGDGFMASFGSATKALECAIAIQQGMTKADVLVRIGLNAGEPIEEDDDLFGTAVNMAARIASKADGGEILVSDVVRQLVAGKKFLVNDRGDAVLRGFEDPVRLYEARWRESS